MLFATWDASIQMTYQGVGVRTVYTWWLLFSCLFGIYMKFIPHFPSAQEAYKFLITIFLLFWNYKCTWTFNCYFKLKKKLKKFVNISAKTRIACTPSNFKKMLSFILRSGCQHISQFWWVLDRVRVLPVMFEILPISISKISQKFSPLFFCVIPK